MKTKIFWILLPVLLFSFRGMAQSEGKVRVIENMKEGNLREILGDDKDIVEDLTIKGDINMTDISFFRDMPNLKRVDIRETILQGWFGQETAMTSGFFGVTLEEVYMPLSITEIRSTCLWLSAKITKIHFGENLKTIGNKCIGKLSSLEELILPPAVTSIGKNSITDLPKLKKLTSLNPEVPSVGQDAFVGINYDEVTLFVPKGSKKRYAQAEGWKNFKKIEEIVEGYAIELQKIGEGEVSFPGIKDLSAVPEGTSVVVDAQPAQEWSLKSVTANGEDITGAKSFTIKAHTTIVVTFQKAVYPVTLEKEGEGDVQFLGADNLSEVEDGTLMSVTAVPQKGWLLKQILINGNPISGDNTFEVHGATVVKVVFEKEAYKVDLLSNEWGAIRIQEGIDLQAVPYGTVLTITATPLNSKCFLESLTANGKDIKKEMSVVVENKLKIQAVFVNTEGVETIEPLRVSLYPNPAKEQLTIDGGVAYEIVEIYAISGEKIAEGVSDKNGSLTLSIGGWNAGKYAVRIGNRTAILIVE